MHWNLGSIHGPLSLPIFDWTEVLWNQVLEGWGFRASEALFRNLRVTSQRRHPSVFTAYGAHAARSVTQPEWQTHTEDRSRHTQTVKSLWIFLMVGTDAAGFLLVCCQCVYVCVCVSDREKIDTETAAWGGSKKINGLQLILCINLWCSMLKRWQAATNKSTYRKHFIYIWKTMSKFIHDITALNFDFTPPHSQIRLPYRKLKRFDHLKISDITYIFTSTAAVHVVRVMTEQRLRSTSLPSLFQNWILKADMQRSSTICQHYLQEIGGFWSFHESVDV